jgi:hypothetical protein
MAPQNTNRKLGTGMKPHQLVPDVIESILGKLQASSLSKVNTSIGLIVFHGTELI